MNESEIKKNIRDIMEYTCNMTLLNFRGINEVTVYNRLKEENELETFVNVIDSTIADCMIFNVLNKL